MHNGHTMQLSFVSDVLLKLIKRPRVQIVSLLAAKPYPLAYAFEFLKSDSSRGAFRKFYDLLADAVVFVTGKARFSPRQTAQDTPRRSGLFGLQTLTLATATFPQREHVRAAVLVAIAVGGKIDQTHVNAKPLVRVKTAILNDIARLMQVPYAVAIHQVGFALQRFKHLALAFAADKRNTLATGHCPDVDLGLAQLPTQHAAVIGHAAHAPEGAFGLGVQFVSVGHVFDYPYRQLRRQAKAFTHGVIGGMVQVIGAERLALPSLVADVVGCIVVRQHRLAQGFGLFWCGLQFDLGDQFHVFKYSIHSLVKQTEFRLRLTFFLSPMNRGVSKRSF